MVPAVGCLQSAELSTKDFPLISHVSDADSNCCFLCKARNFVSQCLAVLRSPNFALVATGLSVKISEHSEGERVLCTRAAQLRKATTWSILERAATGQRPLALLRQVRLSPVLEFLLLPYIPVLYADPCRST